MRDNQHRHTAWSRRGALGAIAAGAASLVGCGGSGDAGGGGTAGAGAGASGSGGLGGLGGLGGAGSAGQAGQAQAGGAGQGSGGVAGAGGSSGLECKQTGPTPGCLVTEDNILGPFYRAGAPFRREISDGATGDTLIIGGTVYGCDCVTPLAGAEVDIWQANSQGAYDNTGYTLRGRAMTDAFGRYEFESIMPGFYLNGATYRPRHVHYMVSHADGVPLTTQLYFEGDPYIPTDPFVRASLVHPLVLEPAPGGGTIYRVSFDIVLA
jgi:catechol 1,2-dioxygenase